jgi:predicted transcriptional regulator
MQSGRDPLRGRLNPYDLEVFRAVQRLKARRGKNASMTALDIAQEADVSKVTVHRSLGRLSKAFYLEVTNAGGSRGYFIEVMHEIEAAQTDADGDAPAASVFA